MTHRSVEVPVVARVEGEGALHVRVDDGEITRLRAGDLRAAALLRVVPARTPLQRGARHRAAHLRHLPRRVPDDRDPRAGAALRDRGARGHVRAASPPLLRGVDREPHAPRPPAGRARLPRVRRGDRDGAEGVQAAGRTRAAAEAGRQRPDGGDRRPGDPPGLARWSAGSEAPRRARAPGVRGRGSRTRSRRSWTWPTSSAPLEMPAFPRDAELVSMVNQHEYPMNEGDMASTRGGRWTAEEYEDVTARIHVAHSNALHSVFADTREPYFVGPLARDQPQRGDPHAGGARGRGARRAWRVPRPRPVPLDGRARGRDRARVRGGAPHDPRRTSRRTRRRPRCGRARAGRRGAPRRRAARSTTATTWPPTARSWRRRSSRPPRRTSGTWRRTCGRSSPACSTARTRSSPAWPRWWCATTTRASPAPRTSCGSTSSGRGGPRWSASA